MPDADQLDVGVLGQQREAGDLVDLRADLVDHPLRVVDRAEQLGGDGAHALAGRRGDRLDPLDGADRLLDLLADALLDLRRAGAGILDGDRDHVELELREQLLAQVEHRPRRRPG